MISEHEMKAIRDFAKRLVDAGLVSDDFTEASAPVASSVDLHPVAKGTEVHKERVFQVRKNIDNMRSVHVLDNDKTEYNFRFDTSDAAIEKGVASIRSQMVEKGLLPVSSSAPLPGGDLSVSACQVLK